MSINHKDITEANLHEMKGASTATNGQIPVANGAGTAVWTTVNNLNKVALNVYFPDMSAATTVHVVSPIAGTITKAYSVVNGTVDADTVLTLKLGSTAVTDGSMTITSSGSAAGDVDSCTPTAANTVSAGQAIKVESDGAATVAFSGTITILLTV